MTYIFSPAHRPEGCGNPLLGGAGGGGLTQGLRARDCSRWLSDLSLRPVSQPLWPTISSLAAPSVWSLFPPPSLSSLLGDAAASVLVGCDLACANCWAYSIVGLLLV